jgi:hypothetical protein
MDGIQLKRENFSRKICGRSYLSVSQRNGHESTSTPTGA